ncbi:hypothetical protein T492DRAFT_431141 [Pavlovales sp. CCMP2436]|nr:hypothetical protein T492DRAFT_431141 [Pavlovales sp. CCMP2436]
MPTLIILKSQARERAYAYSEAVGSGPVSGPVGDMAAIRTAALAAVKAGGESAAVQATGGAAQGKGGAVPGSAAAAGALAASGGGGGGGGGPAYADETQGVVTPTLEPNPKWALLKNILGELHAQHTTEGKEGLPPSILVIVRDASTVYQLSSVLRDGERPFLRKRFVAHAASRHALHPSLSSPPSPPPPLLLLPHINKDINHM